jgi:hypothetical protein
MSAEPAPATDDLDEDFPRVPWRGWQALQQVRDALDVKTLAQLDSGELQNVLRGLDECRGQLRLESERRHPRPALAVPTPGQRRRSA